ncbi:MAG: homoserine dehydrogenase [Eubacteriales bacterium]
MKAAILGFGTVGSGTYEVLSHSSGDVDIKRVLDIRNIPEIHDKITSDINDILNDGEIEIVAETMGGLHPAYEYVTAAIKSGKNIVTSNKMLVAAYYEEFVRLAKENGVTFRFSASAGGGIPWLSNIIRRAATEKIYKIQGIINGTTNYILDSMQTRGTDFAESLAEAQALGYAERDPSSDIDGADIKFKCAISASCAFGVHVCESDIPVFSLRNVSKKDLDYASENGMCIRYLTFASRNSGSSYSAFVEPTLVPFGSLESSVHLNNNLISLFGEYSGRLSFYGQGAGKYPTGAAVCSDMIEIARANSFNVVCSGRAVIDNSGNMHRYFIRTSKKEAEISNIAETYVEREGEYFAITREISVADMHKIADNVKKTDKNAFFAGIYTEV